MKRNVRGIASAAGAMLLLLALPRCGGGTDAGDAGLVPGRSTTAPPASGEPAPGGDETTTVALFFTVGERVGQVSRAVPRVQRIGAEAMKALLAGPTEEEQRRGYGTAIPAGTQLNGLTITDGIARVDLSRTFEGGGGLGLALRLAQVVCTLDAFPTVSGVRFALDGRLVDVLSGDGLVVDRPVNCDAYREHLVGPGPPTTAAATPAGELAIWPFTAVELSTDAAATAGTFADRYLGITDPVTFAFRSTGPETGEVGVGFRRGEGGQPVPNPQPTTFVQLRRVAGGGWTVTGATSPDIEVDAPASGASVTSPVTLTGRARAFEGTVAVHVREDGMLFGQSLGETFVTGRGDGVLGPFTGSATFRQPSKRAGAVVFFERNQADGGSPVLRAAVVRVRFAT